MYKPQSKTILPHLVQDGRNLRCALPQPQQLREKAVPHNVDDPVDAGEGDSNSVLARCK